MKILVCSLALLAGILPSFQARGSTLSDSAALASGYAAAFQCMGTSTVSIVYSNSGQSEVIREVKEIKAFGGTLLIKIYGGEQQILNAGKVIRITEK